MSRATGTNTGRAGFTLVELLLAVAITAIIGLAVTTVLTAASRGMTATRTTQSALQRAHALQARLRSYTDSALCILQYRADDAIAIWLEDTDHSGGVSLSEVRVFWFDAEAGTLSVEYAAFPAGWLEADIAPYDIPLRPSADYFAEMTALRALGYTKTEVLADGLGSIGLAWTEVDVQADPRAVLSMGLRLGDDKSQALVACIGMPNHTEPQ